MVKKTKYQKRKVKRALGLMAKIQSQPVKSYPTYQRAPPPAPARMPDVIGTAGKAWSGVKSAVVAAATKQPLFVRTPNAPQPPATMPEFRSTYVQTVPSITTSVGKAATVGSLAGSDAVKRYATEQLKDYKMHDTGFATYTNPNLDLAHLPASQRQAMMDTQTKRIYGGGSKSVNYLATSMDPAAVAWRAMQRAQGPVTKTELLGGGVGGRPVGGYKYIDISTPESVMESVRTMPERQYADMVSGKEPILPETAGLISAGKLAGYASAQRARKGKKKKQLAKRNIVRVDVGFNGVRTGINVPVVLGTREVDISIRKKRKK